jgi:hypothetical protein
MATMSVGEWGMFRTMRFTEIQVKRPIEKKNKHRWKDNIKIKMAVFWDIAPCSLAEVYRRFRGACCRHHQGDHPRRRKKLKSHPISK